MSISNLRKRVFGFYFRGLDVWSDREGVAAGTQILKDCSRELLPLARLRPPTPKDSQPPKQHHKLGSKLSVTQTCGQYFSFKLPQCSFWISGLFQKLSFMNDFINVCGDREREREKVPWHIWRSKVNFEVSFRPLSLLGFQDQPQPWSFPASMITYWDSSPAQSDDLMTF